MNSQNTPVFNFSAGPCILPKEVFKTCAEEMMDYNGTGLSVMEMSHRSKEFVAISEKAKSDLRQFLQIPNNYKIFFFQGGASLQYAAMIKNLLKSEANSNPCYLTTGLWSSQCINEAIKMCPSDNQPIELATGIKSKYTRIHQSDDWLQIDKNASFVHYCQNETVHGFQFKNGMDGGKINDSEFPFHLVPEGVPIICDMSSDIGSRPVDWTKYGMVYAGAQKNLGTAGCTVVIIREDLIGKQHSDTPYLLDWSLFDKSPNSYFNTPACYPIYVTGLNLAHMVDNGGLPHYEQLAETRSSMLYDMIDNSNGFYQNNVDMRFRSQINVPFRINPNGEDDSTYTKLELKFLLEAAEEGLVQLKGHSSNPGIRASMYNAMPIDGVKKLIEFMEKFQESNISLQDGNQQVNITSEERRQDGLQISDNFQTVSM